MIQQYVTVISEGYNPGDARERERDIWDYDLVGAVGLKESKRMKISTVMYHVRWRGFPRNNLGTRDQPFPKRLGASMVDTWTRQHYWGNFQVRWGQ